MITLYAATATDYSKNGLLVLDKHCSAATISEKLNGEYRLHMELVVNDRTVTIAPEMVIKAPAPVRFTPQLNLYEAAPTLIYEVVTGSGERLNLRTKPSTENGRVLHAYKPGTQVIVTGNTSNAQWYAVAAPDGRSGWMWAGNLQYVRTDSAAPVSSGVIEQKKTREQLFRVQSVSSTLDSIQIEALHISYDLRRNYVASAAVKGQTGAQAFGMVLSSAVTPHEFIAYSDITALIGEDISRRSPIAALLSDGGLIEQAGGELLRDNFDLYWTERIGMDRGVSIAYRKNMAGMDVKIDTGDLVTRIIPVGFDKKSNPIYGDPVDSPYIDQYAQPYVAEYEYKEVKIGNDGFKTEADVRAELARIAALEFEKGIDKPTITASVDYIDLQETDFARNFDAFNGVFLGDTVHIRHEDYGFDFAARVAAYEWDCLKSEYVDIDMGSRQAQLSDVRISPSQIGNGTLPGRKLAAGTVSGAELGEGSITDDHVSNEGIHGEKIVGAVSAVDTKNGVAIDENGVHIVGSKTSITTPDFSVNVPSADGTETMLSIDENGARAKSVSAPDVTPRYAGAAVLYVDPDATDAQVAAGNYFRSLSDALSKLDKKWVGKNVTIHLAAGMVEYGTLSLAGVSGGCWITVKGDAANPAKLMGRLNIYHNSSPVSVRYLDIDTAGNGFYVVGCTTAEYLNGVITGPGTDVNGSYAVYSYSSNVRVNYAELYDCKRSVLALCGGTVNGYGNKGNCRVAVDRGLMYLKGTQPCDSTTWMVDALAGQVYTAGVTVDQGDKPMAEPEPTTVTLNAAVTSTYSPDQNVWSSVSSSWGSDALRQGYTESLGRLRACMWFDAAAVAALEGKTIKQASMRLTRNRTHGSSYGVAVKLYGTSMTSDLNGAPELTKSYGLVAANSETDSTLGLVWDETESFTIPTAAVSDLAAGTIGGLMLLADDDAVWGSRLYSRNYAQFIGVSEATEETAPQITVVYA